MASQLRPFTRVLNADDLSAGSTATDISCPTGSYTKIAYYKVPAQQQIALGAGAIANGVDSREYVKIRFDSSAGQIAGKFRIGYTNANETNVQIVKEERSDNIGTASTVKLGEVTNLRVGQDSYLVIYLNPDATTTVDFSDSDNSVLLPVTVYQ
jgi:uncharacterized membrane protein